MNDDPTRIMRDDDRDPGDGGQYSPEDKQRHLRYLLIGLVAVIVGLVIAVFVISGNNDSSAPVPTGSTDLPAVTGDTSVVPVTPTGPTGPTETTGDTSVTDSGGVTPAPEPDTGTTTPDSGGVTPDSSGTTDSGSQSGGVGP